MLVDTHTHIYLDQFDADRDDVVVRAVNSGITKMLLPNIDDESYEPVLSLCKRYPENIFAMAGLHPTSVKSDYRVHLEELGNRLKEYKYVAIGEVGIDLYWDSTFIEEQKDAFNYQVEIALQYKLPLVVHMRNSFNEIWDVLLPYKNHNLKIVMHCFSGNLMQAKMVIDRGYYLGVGGVVTYKKSLASEIVEYIPLESIVLETDAPYLAPVPYRGKRNEPVFLNIIAEKLAEIRNADLNLIKCQTTQNAMYLFNL